MQSTGFKSEVTVVAGGNVGVDSTANRSKVVGTYGELMDVDQSGVWKFSTVDLKQSSSSTVTVRMATTCLLTFLLVV